MYCLLLLTLKYYNGANIYAKNIANGAIFTIRIKKVQDKYEE